MIQSTDIFIQDLNDLNSNEQLAKAVQKTVIGDTYEIIISYLNVQSESDKKCTLYSDLILKTYKGIFIHSHTVTVISYITIIRYLKKKTTNFQPGSVLNQFHIMKSPLAPTFSKGQQ